MSDTISLLRQLHDLHLRVKTLGEETDQGPRQLRKFQAKIDLAQKQLADAQDTVKHVKVTIHAKEVSIKDNEQTIAKHQKQMNEATSNKEYTALRHEIDNERQANRVLEDEILEAMGELEEKTNLIPAVEKTLAAAQEEYRKAEGLFADRHAGLAERLVEAKTALKAVEASLRPDVRAIYDRLLLGKTGDDSLAPVNGRSCAGCYTELTSQNYNDLRAGRTVACKSCGRLLYLPE